MISLPFAVSFFAPDYNQSGFTMHLRRRRWEGQVVEEGWGLCRRWLSVFEDPNAFEQLVWTAGISYYWKSFTDTDLSDNECVSRSGFSDGCDAGVVGTISLDTTWSALFRVR